MDESGRVGYSPSYDTVSASPRVHAESAKNSLTLVQFTPRMPSISFTDINANYPTSAMPKHQVVSKCAISHRKQLKTRGSSYVVSKNDFILT